MIECEVVVVLGGVCVDVILVSGCMIMFVGLFIQLCMCMVSLLVVLFGCEFEDGLSGLFIRIDGMCEISVFGVFVCGDVVLVVGNVVIVVGDGVCIGGVVYYLLLFC